MTSSKRTEAYVWIWLPNAVEPVVAGRLFATGKTLTFNYGQSYLRRPNAMPLYELPLRQGALQLPPGMSMPGAIRDAAPDAWGRRVIVNRMLGVKGADATMVELDELTYLLESGSDRIGALDFQESPTRYVPRRSGTACLDDLLLAAEAVDKGVPLPPDLALALQHGTSLGGARPKALIDAGRNKFIAKFSSSNDPYNMIKAEFLAMRLAKEAGIDTAKVHLERALGKDVLLVERFDRVQSEAGWRRKAMVSALTILELDEMMAPYASYETLAETVRHSFTAPTATLAEIFRRIVFNVLCGNTDDHARNHSAFWDGKTLALTPAYDLCPQPRTGGEASQAMLLVAGNRMSRIDSCLDASPAFLVDQDKAKAIIRDQIQTIRHCWSAVCDEADLTEADRRFLWRRQFLNPFAFEGAPRDLSENTLLR